MPSGIAFAIYFLISISWIIGFLGRLQVPDRFRISSSSSRLLADSGPYSILSAILAVIVIVWSIVFQLVLAFVKVVGFAKPFFLVIFL